MKTLSFYVGYTCVAVTSYCDRIVMTSDRQTLKLHLFPFVVDCCGLVVDLLYYQSTTNRNKWSFSLTFR